jgi:hypothetical protein
MKHMGKLVALSIIISIFSLLFIPTGTNALSPSPEVYECMEEEKTGKVSSDCALVLCEWNNTEKNWPENTGYYEDCNKSENTTMTEKAIKVESNNSNENKKIIYIIAGALTILGVVGFVLIFKNLSKKS